MSADRAGAAPYRKTWDVRDGNAAGQRFSDAGHRREPLPESAAWNIVSYLLAGLIMLGVPGFLLDRVLGTTWIVGVGIVLGTAVAMLTIWLRYGTSAQASTGSTDVAAPSARPAPGSPDAAPRPTSTSRVPSADRPQEEQS